jgi:hypothetical protein
MRKTLTFIFLIFFTKAFSQEESKELPFKKIYLNLSFLPIPHGILPNQTSFVNFMTSIDIYTKFATNWEGGLSSYHLWLTPKERNPFWSSEHFFITTLYARYYFQGNPYKIFLDISVGKGNLCVCDVNLSTSPSNGGIFRINPFEGNFIGTALGINLKISSFITVKPNVRAYYILNDFEAKGIHIRPLLTFQFFLKGESKSVINNPRF